MFKLIPWLELLVPSFVAMRLCFKLAAGAQSRNALIRAVYKQRDR